MSRLPLIGVTACHQQLGKHPSSTVGDKYVEAAGFAGIPLVMPARQQPEEPWQLLAQLDGVLFTGSPSNVHPDRYQGTPSLDGTLHDPRRDAMTLPLLQAAVDAGVPVFCICRGFQELNVAFGGTLHQRVQDVPGFMDHREPADAPLDEQYAPRHDVCVQPGGLLERLGFEPRFQVNSLHSQGIDRLAAPLRAEAVAPDGLIEAISYPQAPGFVLGVQWHPEWRLADNPVSRRLFEAFREACVERARRR